MREVAYTYAILNELANDRLFDLKAEESRYRTFLPRNIELLGTYTIMALGTRCYYNMVIPTAQETF